MAEHHIIYVFGRSRVILPIWVGKDLHKRFKKLKGLFIV